MHDPASLLAAQAAAPLSDARPPPAPADLLNEQVICICGSDIDDNATIQCDRCGRWQHMPCVGIDPLTDDLEHLTYHCDVCHPRPLDVAAARRYIEQFTLEVQEQRHNSRARRGKGRGRGGSSAQATTQGQAQQQAPPDGAFERAASYSGHRDYSLLDDCIVSDNAAMYITDNLDGFAVCPVDAVPDQLATSVKTINNAPGRYGLFADRPAPAGALVGNYLGVVDLQSTYEADPQNNYAQLMGPKQHVVFVDSTELVIDARLSGNTYRYLRKSCLPNCSIVPLAVMSHLRALKFTIVLSENVSIGTELTVGYGWPGQTVASLPGLEEYTHQVRFAHLVHQMLGECACGQPRTECQIARYGPPPTLAAPTTTVQPATHAIRKRSASIDSTRDDSPAEAPGGSTTETVPLSREERKIQMAIARMEQTDAQPPKAKRRRRNTGDELAPLASAPATATTTTEAGPARPGHSRRPSAIKEEVSQSPSVMPTTNASIADITASEVLALTNAIDVPVRSPSPPVIKTRVRPAKLARLPRSKRASLIRPATPPAADSDEAALPLPRKQRWLAQYLRDRDRAAEQRRQVEKEAKEAAVRLERQQQQRKFAAEQAAKEAKEAAARAAEAAKVLAEREQREAAQRAREREIWGDHPSDPSSAAAAIASVGTGAIKQRTLPPAIQVALANGTAQSSLPGSSAGGDSAKASPVHKMGPPALPMDQVASPATASAAQSPVAVTAGTPTASTLPRAPQPPKIVRKLSVSEYLKQRKEQQAKQASPGSAEKEDDDQDQSDGEVVDATVTTPVQPTQRLPPPSPAAAGPRQARSPLQQPPHAHQHSHPQHFQGHPPPQAYPAYGASHPRGHLAGPPQPIGRPFPPNGPISGDRYGGYPPQHVSSAGQQIGTRPYGGPPPPAGPRGLSPAGPQQQGSSAGHAGYGVLPPTGPRGHSSGNSTAR